MPPPFEERRRCIHCDASVEVGEIKAELKEVKDKLTQMEENIDSFLHVWNDLSGFAKVVNTLAKFAIWLAAAGAACAAIYFAVVEWAVNLGSTK